MSGCDEKVRKRDSAPIDTSAPKAPEVVVPDLNSSVRNSLEVELHGEPQSAILVNGDIIGELDSDGYAKVKIPLQGEDEYGNKSKPIVLNTVKDTTPPVITVNGAKELTIFERS